jgi:hypothetical protein
MDRVSRSVSVARTVLKITINGHASYSACAEGGQDLGRQQVCVG